ncbi:MAG: hypothetical protein GX660_05040 [Clostridiaceae bacterium]|nr:hypothetical protein [Clostridiaceae bacterium]
MATDLSRLKVSLTKHGAHKIAFLLEHFDKDDVLNHLEGDYMDINIDSAQTRRILSIEEGKPAPELWNEIKKYGLEDIIDLVFIAIVFSHNELISALQTGIEEGCVVKRGKIIDGKAYTNFAGVLDEFGFAVEHTPDYVTFDISRIFYKFYIPELVSKLLLIKLTEAGWKKTNSLADECISLDFHKVFGLDPEEFRDWLVDAKEVEEQKIERVKAPRNFEFGIKFKKGHNPKFVGEIEVTTPTRRKATFIHNLIQNEVYIILKKEFPDHEIGTEIPTNVGSVDIVRKLPDSYVLYEIKTSQSIKTNIRQGISQLLEYAYWNNIPNITELVIIGPSPSSKSSIAYLEKLRNDFKLPIYFRYFNLDKVILKEKE